MRRVSELVERIDAGPSGSTLRTLKLRCWSVFGDPRLSQSDAEARWTAPCVAGPGLRTPRRRQRPNSAESGLQQRAIRARHVVASHRQLTLTLEMPALQKAGCDAIV